MAEKQIRVVELQGQEFEITEASALQGLQATAGLLQVAARHPESLRNLFAMFRERSQADALTKAAAEEDRAEQQEGKTEDVADAEGQSMIVNVLAILEPVWDEAPGEVIAFAHRMTGIEHGFIMQEITTAELIILLGAILQVNQFGDIMRALSGMAMRQEANDTVQDEGE